MIKGFLFAVILAVFTNVAWTQVPQDKAADSKLAVKKWIDISDALSLQDQKVNDLYGQLSKILPPKEAQALREQQEKWLATRDACGNDTEIPKCIFAAFDKRQAELAELIAKKSPTPNLKSSPKFRKISQDGKVVHFDKDYFKAYEMLDLLPIFEKARKPKTKLDEKKLLGQLWFYYSAQLGGPPTGNRLDGVKPTVSGMSYSVASKDDDASEDVEVLALSDFDGDGVEDVLIMHVTGYRGAAHWYYTYSLEVLTHKPGESNLSVIRYEEMGGCGISERCAPEKKP